jgi:hypothetical protein
MALRDNRGNLDYRCPSALAHMFALGGVRPYVRAAQRPAGRLCFAVARGGAYCFGAEGNGSRIGSGLILARITFKVLMRGDMKRGRHQ